MRHQRFSDTAHNHTPTGSVMIFAPGGLEHNGCIGCQMGYFLRAAQGAGFRHSYSVVDPRRPWFLHIRQPYIIIALLCFAQAALKLLIASFAKKRTIAHFNIAGRGSTIRKAVLAKLARMRGVSYVMHVHDPDYTEEYRTRGRLVRWLIRDAFGAADRILVLRARDHKLLSKLLAVQSEKITVPTKRRT